CLSAPSIILQMLRSLYGTTLIRAFVRNLRTCPAMLSEKAQVASTARPKVAMRRTGADHLVVDEGSVMELERRRRVTAVGLGQPAAGGARQSTEGGSLRAVARAG